VPKLTIDGQEIEFEPGTTVLQAALSRGREIPHYCYHPALSISGNCRMCLVEVEKAPKLVIGCATVATDGMVVHTDSDKVKTARAAMMEFFLINHPLDCPICDQAGECKLQEYSAEHGTGVSRSVEPRLELDKAIDLGPHVVLDQERCIQCSRCIRFCDEVAGTGELGFFRRGERTVIGTVPGRPLANPYSGNVVDICPVGALTLKEFRFKTRVWYLKNTPSVCVACTRGCNVMIGVGQQQIQMTTQGQLDDSVKRLTPRFNAEVNGYWMCDEGRLSYQRLYAAPRILRAESPDGTRTDWDSAVRKMAATLKQSGKGRVAAVLSPRLTAEDLFAWKAFFAAVGDVRLGVRKLVRGRDDALLIRADKGGNSQSAAWIFGNVGGEEKLLEAAGRGEVDTLIVLGDPLDPADNLTLPAVTRGRINSVVFVGPFRAGAAEGANVVLPTAAWSEQDGTVVNFEGRIQRVRRAHLPRGEGRPGWKVAAEVAAAGELPWKFAWASPEAVFADLAREVREFAGVGYDDVGMLGVPGAAATSAS